MPGGVKAATFMINDAGSQGDADAMASGGDDLVCDINIAMAGNQCTLRAAIQEANDQTGIHNITFQNDITSITLTQALDALTAPVNINGTTNNPGSGNRVDINGNNLGCLSLGETTTAANANGARGSTIQNLVIRNCSGNGITLVGHGYTVSGNRIGTNAAGSGSDFNNDANDGDGISLAGTAAQPNTFPNVGALIDDPPANLGEIAAFVTALQAALTVVANPTFITGNLISGNKGDGIDLFTPSTVNVQVNTNIVGIDQAGLVSVPNGRGTGDGAGIRMTGGAYGNVIGPGNIVSGQNEDDTDDGIVITGDVLVPNFLFGNLIGLGSAPGTDVGNGDIGLSIDTEPDTDGIGADNPTGFSLFVGPANTVSDNRSNNGGASLDSVGGDVSGGIVITGTASGVRVYTNVIGLGTFPAGGTPIGALEYGNRGNGIVVTSSNNQIGGSEVFEANLILANERHGILVRGADVVNVPIRNNFIGASDPTGLGIFGFGNRGDGIYIVDASSIQIGGIGEFDDNVIAANGRHGIKLLDNGSEDTSGWSNHFQRNQIYGNNQDTTDGITGLGIDLDVVANAPDPTDDTPAVDPNLAYGNFAQNAPIACTGVATPDVLCGTGAAYQPGSGTTSLQWTLRSRPNGSYRIEFFQLRSDGMTFLNEQVIATDASGRPSGAGCVAGLCTSAVAPGSPVDTRGTQVVMTATDLQLADVPPLDEMPPIPDTASNNTSEFSNPAGVPDPGELRFELAAYTVDESAGTVTITAQRINGDDGIVTATYTSANGSATAGTDYTTTTGTLTWNDQDTTNQTFVVPILPDAIDEDDETLTLTLSNPTNNAILVAPSVTTVTITDNDQPPTLMIADADITEGNSGTTPMTFTVSLSEASGKIVTVSAQSGNGSALAGSDYTSLPATPIVFAPGDTSESIDVQVNGDTAIEPDETFFVNLSGAMNASIADAQGQGTILDDDATFSIDDQSTAEGQTGPSTLTFNVSRTSGTGPASVSVASNDGTAAAGSDFVGVAPTVVNFADGVTSQPVVVTINGDTVFEANETFTIVLSNPVGATIADGTGTGTITNDDTLPNLSINDVSMTEGNSGNTPFGFVISLSNAADQPITVTANTMNGSATSGTDYMAVTGTIITFAPGEMSQPIAVQVAGDTDNEPAETFTVQLSAPTVAAILDAEGLGTIQNDDAGTSEFNIDDQSVAEGQTGTTTMLFTVTRTLTAGAASVSVTSANGTAIAGTDFVAVPPTTLNFADGDGSETIAVTINGDTVFEANETFAMNLTNPIGGTIADGSGLGTITNDDTQPTASINDVSLPEGNTGTTSFPFVVSLSNASDQSITVTAGTVSGTAIGGSDFTEQAGTLLTFAPGITSQPMPIQVSGDLVDEPTENFTVFLSMATGASIADAEGLATIQNDDAAAGTFSINDASTAEGQSGTSLMTFTVARTSGSGAASVSVSTSNGTANAGSDYVAIAPTIVNFADGDTTETVSVTINGDTTVEPDETFTMTLSNPVGATIADDTGIATIQNDDVGGGSTLVVGDATLIEGNTGTSLMTFTVTRSSGSGTASVLVISANGTAEAGIDYTALAATTLNFADGITTTSVDVTINGDAITEPDEVFTVILSNPVGATIADDTATGTITNDDAPPSLSINDVSLIEGNAGTTAFVFDITLSNVSSQPITVDLQTMAGTATAGIDYQPPVVTTLTIVPGDVAESVTVQVIGDLLDEPNETFTLNLSNAVNATIVDAQGIGTIEDEDVAGGVGNITPVPALDAVGRWLLMMLVFGWGLLAMRRRMT